MLFYIDWMYLLIWYWVGWVFWIIKCVSVIGLVSCIGVWSFYGSEGVEERVCGGILLYWGVRF